MPNRFARAALGALAIQATALLAPVSLRAQDAGTIRGHVVEAFQLLGVDGERRDKDERERD